MFSPSIGPPYRPGRCTPHTAQRHTRCALAAASTRTQWTTTYVASAPRLPPPCAAHHASLPTLTPSCNACASSALRRACCSRCAASLRRCATRHMSDVQPACCLVGGTFDCLKMELAVTSGSFVLTALTNTFLTRFPPAVGFGSTAFRPAAAVDCLERALNSIAVIRSCRAAIVSCWAASASWRGATEDCTASTNW